MKKGVKSVGVNLSKLHRADFWYVMDHKNWVHPYAFGKRYSYAALPKSIDKLEDDPFRSLAGELRWAGGFSKETIPYSEFLWGDFLRRRLDSKEVERDYNRAFKKALE
jgi:hypothetical protein